jgi:general secretion pathway protein B
MSYILNALRKSEQERQARQAETATDRILLPRPKQSRRTGLWITAIVLSNVLIISGFIWLNSKKTAPSAPQAPITSPVEKSAHTPPEKPSISKIQSSIQPSAPVTAAKEPASTSLAEQAAANTFRRNALQSKAGNDKKPSSARSSEPSDDAKNAFINRRENAQLPANQPPPEELNSAPSELNAQEPAPAANHRIPFLEELPYDVRQSIPKMTVNVFVYSPEEPTESFVVINMEKYRAGQLTKDSVELKEIRFDSLVANYHDHTFRIGRPGPQRVN